MILRNFCFLFLNWHKIVNVSHDSQHVAIRKLKCQCIKLHKIIKHIYWQWVVGALSQFLARWLTSARAYRIGGRKLCPSVCLYVKRYLLLQFCTDYNQTWINMIWAVAAKTLLSQFFHNWRRIEVNCVYISHCKWYRTSAGMPACIPNRRCCAGQCAGQ